MLKVFLFLKDIVNVILYNEKKRNDLSSKILSQLNLILGIFTLKPKLSEFYSDCVKAFCPCRTYIRRRWHMRAWFLLKEIPKGQFLQSKYTNLFSIILMDLLSDYTFKTDLNLLLYSLFKFHYPIKKINNLKMWPDRSRDQYINNFLSDFRLITL